MAVRALQEGTSHNPRTVEEARLFVTHVESLFMPWNVDALVDGFTEDCVVHFATLPPFRGREVLRAFFANRSARQKNYRLTKRFRTLMGDTITAGQRIADLVRSDETRAAKDQQAHRLQGFGIRKG